MGDSQVLDFQIKSQIHNYEVNFIDNSVKILNNFTRDDDVIIIDKRVNKLYSDLISSVNNYKKVIILEATESQKSYHALTPIIQDLINCGFRKNHRLIV